MLIQMLKLAIPSLARALSGGLITTLTPPRGAALRSDLARLPDGSAQRYRPKPGWRARHHAPPAKVTEVWRLQIADLAVGGVSGLRLAG